MGHPDDEVVESAHGPVILARLVADNRPQPDAAQPNTGSRSPLASVVIQRRCLLGDLKFDAIQHSNPPLFVGGAVVSVEETEELQVSYILLDNCLVDVRNVAVGADARLHDSRPEPLG